jgi:hypothetical protein
MGTSRQRCQQVGYFGWTFGSPPGDPGGGTTLIAPPAAGFCVIAESTPGGQMTPRDSASLSLSVAPGLFCRVSGGQFRSGAAAGLAVPAAPTRS